MEFPNKYGSFPGWPFKAIYLRSFVPSPNPFTDSQRLLRFEPAADDFGRSW